MDGITVHPDAHKAQVAAGPNEIWAELCTNTRVMIRRLEDHKEVVRAGIEEARETNRLMRQVLEMHKEMHSELMKAGQALVKATERMETTIAEQNKVLQLFQAGEESLSEPIKGWQPDPVPFGAKPRGG